MSVDFTLLDDFPLLHKSCLSLQQFIECIYRIMNDIGLPIASKKMLDQIKSWSTLV